MSPPPLLHRYIDPLLGVFTGVLAYYLHETHPRMALPPDQRLMELIRWKREKTQRQHQEQLCALGTTDRPQLGI